ncbi:hypothetical protein DDB_G0279155 [Dictyostelium discoideum AX4]|uniref:THUMP domain-containing protein n=1 Tax=Dictyostelium discoideum TaxID=44689 RepID=Q54X76_DICDI|nr:hypothetical protein DDB_G0279155 [Dictyostelium discoideum AX4]EAL67877.1 hypothetical protein DDB_G0279155 [Dictyostelium discoideum AX4]|eukprot:XP_641852.1 hypothetical protein DDB_G0279155 [Dictyostelium discoideum AX4]
MSTTENQQATIENNQSLETENNNNNNDETCKKRTLEETENKNKNFVNKKLRKEQKKKETKENKKQKTLNNQENKKENVDKKDEQEEATTDPNDYDEKKVIFKGKFKSWKKHSRLFATDEVVKGLLVCCDSMREANSIGEMLPLLNIFADKYFPKEEKEEEMKTEKVNSYYGTNEQKQEGTTDVEPSELKKRKRFELINSGCGGIYFISIPIENVDPIDFMNCIFVDIYKRQMVKKNLSTDFIDNDIIKNFPESTKKMLENANQSIFIADKVLNRVIFTSKVLPILRTFRASEVDMYPIMREVIKENFKNAQGKTFAIELRSRNNSSLEKNKVIKDIAEMVDPSIKVDLSNPDLVIVIEIIKSSVVTSVIPQYKKLFKLNLREVIKCELDRKPSQSKQQLKDEKKQQLIKKQEQYLKEKEEKEKEKEKDQQQKQEEEEGNLKTETDKNNENK